MKRIIFVLIYVICYQMVHVLYLYKNFGYMGYMVHDLQPSEAIMSLVFILLPLRFFPKGSGFLQIFFTFSYLLLYVPVIITFANQYDTLADIFYNQIFFVLGFYLIFFIPTHYKMKVRGIGNKPPPRSILIYVGSAITLFLLYQFKDTFALVQFEDVYGHRSELTYSSPIIGYLVIWNTYFIGPLVLVNGLIYKKRVYTILGVISIIATYGINASKIVLFIPGIIIATYYIIKKGQSIFNIFCTGFSALMLLLLAVSQKFFMLSAVILMRTFGIAGLLTYQYNEFFKVSPLTYLSHVNIVNFFTNSYPYNDALGFIVSAYYNAGSTANANANFLATDGLAGFGLMGVILISILMGFYLSFLSAIVNEKNRMLVLLMLIPFCFIVLNVSFFTAIFSGGFVFLNIYYWIFSQRKSISAK